MHFPCEILKSPAAATHISYFAKRQYYFPFHRCLRINLPTWFREDLGQHRRELACSEASPASRY